MRNFSLAQWQRHQSLPLRQRCATTFCKDLCAPEVLSHEICGGLRAPILVRASDEYDDVRAVLGPQRRQFRVRVRVLEVHVEAALGALGVAEGLDSDEVVPAVSQGATAVEAAGSK